MISLLITELRVLHWGGVSSGCGRHRWPVGARPELLAAMGVGKVGAGAAIGGGFDAFGQLTNPNNGEYRGWQTATAAATGALMLPFAGRNAWLDAGLGASSGGIVTAVTNEIYDRNDGVARSIFLGSTFGYLGNRVGVYTTNSLESGLPRYIGGSSINRDVPILLQNIGRPNPLVPYIDTIGTSLGTVVSGVPSLAPGMFSEPSSAEKP